MTPAKIRLSRDELEEHLRDQLDFIRASADAYDAGCIGEAKRLAVSLRVLLHDTDRSYSLLGQLNRLSGAFFSTAFPPVPENVSTHGGLVMIGMKGRETRYLAMLDSVPYKRWLPFPEWWKEAVFIDEQRRQLRRRDLVLTAANQDGGAHVDPALDATYHALAKGNSLGWTYHDDVGDMAIPLPERAALRQIAHETLVTLLPEYSKEPDHEVDMFAGPVMAFDSSTPPPLPKPVAEPRRNDPCPCDSGRKYKRCHGRPTSGSVRRG